MRYTFRFSTKCGANNVKPGKTRSRSQARNPTPRRLRVFCSIAAMSLLPPWCCLQQVRQSQRAAHVVAGSRVDDRSLEFLIRINNRKIPAFARSTPRSIHAPTAATTIRKADRIDVLRVDACRLWLVSEMAALRARSWRSLSRWMPTFQKGSEAFTKRIQQAVQHFSSHCTKSPLGLPCRTISWQ